MRELYTGLYRHFKGGVYLVQNLCENSETGEVYVHYMALYGENKCYVRNARMFISEIDREKYPDSSNLYRFEEPTKEQLEDFFKTVPPEQVKFLQTLPKTRLL